MPVKCAAQKHRGELGTGKYEADTKDQTPKEIELPAAMPANRELRLQSNGAHGVTNRRTVQKSSHVLAHHDPSFR